MLCFTIVIINDRKTPFIYSFENNHHQRKFFFFQHSFPAFYMSQNMWHGEWRVEKGNKVKMTSPSPEDIQTRELWRTAIIVLKIMQYKMEVMCRQLICVLCFRLLHMWTVKKRLWLLIQIR